MTEQSWILVGNDRGGTVAALRIDDDRLVAGEVTEVGVGCSTFAVDSTRDLVYCAVKDPSPAIVTLRLDRATGALSEVARRSVSDPMAYLAITPYALLGASYHGGWGASWQVVDGVVGHETSHFERRNLHAAVPDPAGENAYFVSLGEDLIAQFAIAMDGQLIELSEPTIKVAPGSGPRHLVVSPDDRNAYLLTEFTAQAIRFDRSEGGRLTAAEQVPAFDASSGLHESAFGRDPRAEHLIWGADLVLAGGWLLCTERTASTVAAIALDPSGRLTDTVVLSPTESQPRGLTVSPDGERIVVVGELSDHAALYRLDDGRLVELDRVETGRGPDWVRFA